MVFNPNPNRNPNPNPNPNPNQLKLRIMRVSHETFAKPTADGAKALVRELLQQLAESRLTAKQVLVHPWLAAHSA